MMGFFLEHIEFFVGVVLTALTFFFSKLIRKPSLKITATITPSSRRIGKPIDYPFGEERIPYDDELTYQFHYTFTLEICILNNSKIDAYNISIYPEPVLDLTVLDEDLSNITPLESHKEITIRVPIQRTLHAKKNEVEDLIVLGRKLNAELRFSGVYTNQYNLVKFFILFENGLLRNVFKKPF